MFQRFVNFHRKKSRQPFFIHHKFDSFVF